MRFTIVIGCLALMTILPAVSSAEEVLADAPPEDSGDLVADDGTGTVLDNVGFHVRAGVLVPAYMSPNFFGFGAVVDKLVTFGGGFGVGLRIDAAALYGFALDGQDVSVGVRGLGAVLAKGEYTLGSGGVQPMVGLSAGMFAVMVMGADVGDENVGAIAGGGRAFGLAPQIGVDLGSFRIAAVSYLIFAGSHLEPVFGLELSGVVRRFAL